jgi:small-conductance mechanosensitive channel
MSVEMNYGLLLELALIILIVFVGRLLLQVAYRRLLSAVQKDVAESSRAARIKTLAVVCRDILFALLIAAGAVAFLSLLGINITGLVAVAGTLGLALSLGAQNYVKDIIGGVVILVEDQFKIGDVVTLQGISGTVERMTLRATYLRDVRGQLHLIANGDVRTVTNQTAVYSKALVELTLGFDADVAAAVRVLEEAMRRLCRDESMKATLVEEPEVAGWAGLLDYGVIVRLSAKVAPGKQWEAMTRMREAGLRALKDEGIELALPVQQNLARPE